MTLFAKLIFPPFKWEPARERGERGEGASVAVAASVKEAGVFALVWKEGEREKRVQKCGSVYGYFFHITSLHQAKQSKS